MVLMDWIWRGNKFNVVGLVNVKTAIKVGTLFSELFLCTSRICIMIRAIEAVESIKLFYLQGKDALFVWQ